MSYSYSLTNNFTIGLEGNSNALLLFQFKQKQREMWLPHHHYGMVILFQWQSCPPLYSVAQIT